MKPVYTTLLILLLACTGAFSQNQNISNAAFFEGEPYIAVNPVNPKNIVVAWMGFVFGNGSALTIKVKSSFNGGNTWGAAVLMPHISPTYKSADVSMAFDGSGNLFLAYIDYRENPDSGGVYVAKSVNGGVNWSAPVKAIDAYADGDKKPIDRPWLVCNNSGTRLYITTKPAPWINAPNRPYIVYSDDGGINWKPWKYLDGTGYLVGNIIAAPMATPAIAGTETFHAVYPSFLASQSIFARYILASSFNGAATFNYQVVLNGLNAAANDTAKLAYHLTADPSDTNHLVFVYPATTFGDIDIMLTESFNAGLTWTTPLRVNDDVQGNGKMQDMLWVDFNNSGDLVVTWRDRRNAPGFGYTQPSEFYYTYRPKDSAGFRVNKPLTDNIVAYNAILEQKGNDFMSCKLANDTLYAVWGDTKDGSLDIWMAKINIKSSVVTSVQPVDVQQKMIKAFPNPVRSQLQLSLNNNELIRDVTVITEAGAVVLQKTYNSKTVVLNLASQKPGTCFVIIRTKNNQYTRKIVKQ